MFDFTKAEEKAATMTTEALAYSILDCCSAMMAMKGWNPEAEGRYADEGAVYRNELAKRAVAK